MVMARGFTMVELLLSVFILTAIVSFSTYIYLSYYVNKTLDTAGEVVHTTFSRAYLDTIGSKSDAQYGVHIASDRVVLFTGAVYNPAAPENVDYSLGQGVEIANISLSGGGSEVVYQRVTGSTAQSGTFQIRSIRDSSNVRNVTIHPVGLVSVK